MQNFLKIEKHSDFFDLFEKYNLKRWFRFKDFVVNGIKFRTYFYSAQLQQMFKGIDETDSLIRRELRGITFNLDKNIISARPIHKFFNIQEVENYNISKIISVQTKIDGSMIHPFLAKNQVIFKSKKSHTSEIAKEFNLFIQKSDFYQKFVEFNKILLQNNLTPIYEFYHPKHIVILKYDKPFFKLLAIRHNFTGNYLEFNTIKELKQQLAKIIDLDNYKFINPEFIPKRWNYDFNTLMKLTEQLTNYEGFVIVNDKSERYKIKTKWYFQAHFYTFEIGIKTMFEYWTENKLDDLKSFAQKNNLIRLLDNLEKFQNKISKLNNNLEKIHRVLTKNCNCKKIDKKQRWFYSLDIKNKNSTKRTEIFYNFVISELMRNPEVQISELIEQIKKLPFKKVKKLLSSL